MSVHRANPRVIDAGEPTDRARAMERVRPQPGSFRLGELALQLRQLDAPDTWIAPRPYRINTRRWPTVRPWVESATE
jgi:hypothetical protein